MALVCLVVSSVLGVASIIPGPIGTVCGVGAKVVDGIGMLTGGTPIKQVVKYVAKEVVKDAALSMVGGKIATKLTKAYGAKKAVEIAKNAGKAKQIVQQAKGTGKAIDYGARLATKKAAKVAKKVLKLE